LQEKRRCPWPYGDPLMIAYHDEEWGIPVHDDRKHFEFLVLDCFQAGLSWRTVLHKRKNFGKAFDRFDFRKIARYDGEKVISLLGDAGIIRNRAKILGTIQNAKCFIKVREEFGSFDRYIWQFTGGRTIYNRIKNMSDIPSRSEESDAMSRDLVSRGFTFVGSTICYAYMQAAGMVNDHVAGCFRYTQE
jgi:DNA-3-methyladenine glycosylase I